ncbi:MULTISPECIES: hypothetical protein [Acinetobacter]|uniref:hypothetical protein n=1 Tax=Acinetobacter TaxID=469 RepID=UPI000DCFEB4F|nr:hypothetical protein [Acinetobacter sp. CFCC 10889]
MDKFFTYLGTIFFVVILWFGISKGLSYYTKQNIFSEQDEKIAFLEKNNASLYERCDAINTGLIHAKNYADQNKFNKYNEMLKSLHCI